MQITAVGGGLSAPGAGEVAAACRNSRPDNNAVDVAKVATRPEPVSGSASDISSGAGVRIALAGPAESGRNVDLSL